MRNTIRVEGTGLAVGRGSLSKDGELYIKSAAFAGKGAFTCIIPGATACKTFPTLNAPCQLNNEKSELHHHCDP